MSRFRIQTPWTKWPLNAPTEGPGANTYYPLELDLTQAMRYYYRCRHWVLSWTITSGVWTGGYSYGIDTGFGLDTLTDEQELILNGALAGFPAWPEPSQWLITGTLGPVDDVSMTWECQFMLNGLAQVDDKYYPQIFLQLNPGEGQAIVTREGDSLAGTIDFDGIATIPYYSATGTAEIADVSIYPAPDYWEYRDRDNLNPIYDITTGAPLLPVFSNDYEFDS